MEIRVEQIEEFMKIFKKSKISKKFLEECKQSAIKTGKIKDKIQET